MNTHRGMLKQITKLGLFLMMGVSMSAGAGLFGFGGTSWKEEVLLHDGKKLVVERRVERGGRHEIGQKPPYKEQSLSFVLPGTGQTARWEDRYSEDIGTANFIPMGIDIVNDTPYLVVTPMGCLSYNKWGRPNPPYVNFRYEGHQWAQIPLRDLPSEIKRPNLIVSDPDTEIKRLGKDFATAEEIRRANEGFQQPQYKTILREPLKPGSPGVSCAEMVYDGKGGWIGIGWFKDQPSREACLRYCARNQIAPQFCPCDRFFKEGK